MSEKQVRELLRTLKEISVSLKRANRLKCISMFNATNMDGAKYIETQVLNIYQAEGGIIQKEDNAEKETECTLPHN